MDQVSVARADGQDQESVIQSILVGVAEVRRFALLLRAWKEAILKKKIMRQVTVGTVRYGTVRYGTVRYGTVPVRYGTLLP